MNINKTEKHNLFALDAIGALMSTFYLSIVYYFDKFFGMPKSVVIIFIGIGIALFLYSTFMYLTKPVKWQIYLASVAILNYCYCIYTLYNILCNLDNLTLYGYIYFILEIIVIIILATYELQVSRKTLNS